MFGVLVFGASITFGRGERPNVGWTGRLKEHVELQGHHHCLFNLAISGNSTTDLLQRFDTEAEARVVYKRPGDEFVILIAIGTNDTRGLGEPDKVQTPIDTFRTNVLTLVEKAKKLTSKVAVIGLTPVDEKRTVPFEKTYFFNARIKGYDEQLRAVAEGASIPFISLFDKLNNDGWKTQLFDGLHPSREGYEKMYAIILKQLQDSSLIK